MQDVIMNKVVTGSAKYVDRKVAELTKNGWSIVNVHNHPNGDKTVKLKVE